MHIEMTSDFDHAVNRVTIVLKRERRLCLYMNTASTVFVHTHTCFHTMYGNRGIGGFRQIPACRRRTIRWALPLDSTRYLLQGWLTAPRPRQRQTETCPWPSLSSVSTDHLLIASILCTFPLTLTFVFSEGQDIDRNEGRTWRGPEWVSATPRHFVNQPRRDTFGGMASETSGTQ